MNYAEIKTSVKNLSGWIDFFAPVDPVAREAELMTITEAEKAVNYPSVLPNHKPNNIYSMPF
jgi:hypothetical protein